MSKGDECAQSDCTIIERVVCRESATTKMANKKKTGGHRAKIAARRLKNAPKAPDIFDGCIASQLREDLRGKVSYIRINGEGEVTPVADIETIVRMVKLLKKDGAAELFSPGA